MVLQSILQESRGHYQAQYDHLVARLIHIPKGSLRKQSRKRAHYWYLRRHSPERGYRDVYIGPGDDKASEAVIEFVRERRKRTDELNAVKVALKQLGITQMEQQEKNYPAFFIQLLDAFGKVGLWQEGLSLIGSWSFNVYVQAFDVDFFPLRTMDFDFGLRVPYTGDKTDIDELLKNLGFTARVDMAYDKIDYILPGVGMVEVFIDREQGTAEEIKRLKQHLSLRPAVVTYLHLLTDHPVTVKIHGVHKAITLPSLSAFFVHRLITAKFGEYRDPVDNIHKIRKDYKQAALVAKRILSDNELRPQLDRLVATLPDDLKQKMLAGADAAESLIKRPDLSEDDIQHIQNAANRYR